MFFGNFHKNSSLKSLSLKTYTIGGFFQSWVFPIFKIHMFFRNFISECKIKLWKDTDFYVFFQLLKFIAFCLKSNFIKTLYGKLLTQKPKLRSLLCFKFFLSKIIFHDETITYIFKLLSLFMYIIFG